jgi:hypothetical protein
LSFLNGRARFDPLPPRAQVFRVAFEGKAYLPAGAEFPTDAFFAPSDDDRAEATERCRRTSLSCWDSEWTTTQQAIGIRRREGSSFPGEACGFSLGVDEVEAAGRRYGIPLVVEDDRLDPTEHGPGAEGHCGIVGLDRREQVRSRNEYKSLREELARSVRRRP